MEEIVQTELIRIRLPEFETNILKYICQGSNSLCNQAVYYVWQNHLLTHPGNLPRFPYEQMANELKDEPNYKQLYSRGIKQGNGCNTAVTLKQGVPVFRYLIS